MIERYFYKLALIGQVMSSKSVKFNFDSVVEKKFIRSSKDAIVRDKNSLSKMERDEIFYQGEVFFLSLFFLGKKKERKKNLSTRLKIDRDEKTSFPTRTLYKRKRNWRSG